jgi:hypothetical protein
MSLPMTTLDRVLRFFDFCCLICNLRGNIPCRNWHRWHARRVPRRSTGWSVSQQVISQFCRILQYLCTCKELTEGSSDSSNTAENKTRQWHIQTQLRTCPATVRATSSCLSKFVLVPWLSKRQSVRSNREISEDLKIRVKVVTYLQTLVRCPCAIQCHHPKPNVQLHLLADSYLHCK